MAHLSILPDAAFFFKAFLDGEDCFTLLPFEKRVVLWKKALQQLDQDVQVVADLYKDKKYGEYSWCFTWENHRNDGVLGTVYHYYLQEIILELSQSHTIDKLAAHRCVPKLFMKLISSKLQLKGKYISGWGSKEHLVNGFRKYLSPGRHFFELFLRKTRKNAHSNIQKATLIATRNEAGLRRYKHYYTSLPKEQVLLYHPDILRNVKSWPDGIKTIDFKTFFSVSMLFSSFFTAFGIKKTIKSQQKHIHHNLFYSYVKSQSLLQYWVLSLKKKLFEKAIQQLSPTALACNASITDPISRLPLTIAHQKKLETITVGCRSMISSLRGEDRIIPADLQNYNDTYISDRFLVNDEYSKNTWVSQGLDEDIISYNSATGEKKVSENTFHIENGLIVLFTQYEYNTRICELLAKSKLGSFDKIYIRSHPNGHKKNQVSDYQKEKLMESGLQIEDITQIPMSELHCTNTVSITANSTAGVEIVSTGSGIVWFPFLTEHSLQFFDVMQHLGIACMKSSEVYELFSETLNSSENIATFVEQCEKAYNQHFGIPKKSSNS